MARRFRVAASAFVSRLVAHRRYMVRANARALESTTTDARYGLGALRTSELEELHM